MTAGRLALAVALIGIAARAASALDFATPLSGAVVRSGTSVHVRVTPTDGEQIRDVTFATRDGGTSPVAGALEADVPVPLDGVGPEFIIAYARLLDGGVSMAFVEVVADPGPLRKITVIAPPLLTRIGQLGILQVSGLFADDVTRNLSGSDRGTTYTTTDSSVLGIHPTGVVQARAAGTAQIAVTNRGRSAVVTMPVAVPSPPDNRIPVPTAGLDQVVAPEAVVTLSGAATDPDGDAVTVTWEQIKGPAVLLRDADTTGPYFAAPRVGTETILEFALTATDSKGATSFPAVVRITVRP
jgi:hypothetical protein